MCVVVRFEVGGFRCVGPDAADNRLPRNDGGHLKDYLVRSHSSDHAKLGPRSFQSSSLAHLASGLSPGATCPRHKRPVICPAEFTEKLTEQQGTLATANY